MDGTFETKNVSVLEGTESFLSETNRDFEDSTTTPLKLSSNSKLKHLKKVSINVKANIEYREDIDSRSTEDYSANEKVKQINNRRKRRSSYYLKYLFCF